MKIAYVRFELDPHWCQGWAGFAPIESALRLGARKLGWQGLQGQELVHAERVPSGNWVLVFKVWR